MQKVFFITTLRSKRHYNEPDILKLKPTDLHWFKAHFGEATTSVDYTLFKSHMWP